MKIKISNNPLKPFHQTSAQDKRKVSICIPPTFSLPSSSFLFFLDKKNQVKATLFVPRFGLLQLLCHNDRFWPTFHKLYSSLLLLFITLASVFFSFSQIHPGGVRGSRDQQFLIWISEILVGHINRTKKIAAIYTK